MKLFKTLLDLNVFFVALLLTVFISSCEDEDNATDGQSVTANAGVDQTTDVGTSVNLDATASNAEGDNITYTWTIVSSPEGSTASIASPLLPQTTFTPDRQGVYTIVLLVSANGTSDADSLNVTAISSGSIEIDGDITEDATWSDHLSDENVPDYIIKRSIDIEAALTIEPGVLIHVAEDAMIEVPKGGVLMASGEAGNLINITSVSEAGNIHWGGINFKSSDSRNELNYVRIAYAGNNDMFYIYSSFNAQAKANVGLEGEGKLKIKNSFIENSSSYGFVTDPDASLTDFGSNTFKNNTKSGIATEGKHAELIDDSNIFEGNGHNGVLVYGSEIPSGEKVSWRALSNSASYNLTGELSILGKLTLYDGAKVEIDEDVFIEVKNTGIIDAKGTASNPVILTTSNLAGQIHWGGLLIESSNSLNSLDYVEISYGGGEEQFYIYDDYDSYAQANVIIADGGILSITNSSIDYSELHGLVIDKSGELDNFSDNSFSNNNSSPVLLPSNIAHNIDANTSFSDNKMSAVQLLGTNIDDDQTWIELNNDAEYNFIGAVTVKATLTLNPGAHLTFNEAVLLKIGTGGALIAKGTSTNRVVFTTSDENNSIHWGGIIFESSSSLNEMDFVEISYGGGVDHYYFYGDVHDYVYPNISVDDDAKLTLTNTIVSDSDVHGLAIASNGTVNGIETSSTTIIDDISAANTFQNNTLDIVVE